MKILRAERAVVLRLPALLPGALLLLALVVGGVHHHASQTGSHSCTICSLSHVPATGSVVVAASVPVLLGERVAVDRVVTPGTAFPVSPSSRGPPSV
jgi:hypothetical protein